MTDREIMESPKALARIAAVLFLIIFIQGISAELFIRQNIFVPGDATGQHSPLPLGRVH